jgi:hypothetical protein
MCRSCHAAWFADPRFSAGAIESAYGEKPDHDSEHRAFVAEAIKRTAAWVAERTRGYSPHSSQTRVGREKGES